MGHRLTGIPSGSTVYVHAQCRFPQWKGVVSTGSITLVSTPPCYPIQVSVRPTHLAPTPPGAFKNYGKMAPEGMPNELIPSVAPSSPAENRDFVIQNAQEFVAPELPEFLHLRQRDRAEVDVRIVPSAPGGTDIYQRPLCSHGCGNPPIQGRPACATCEPPPKLCIAPRATSAGISECPNPCYKDLSVCFMHAKEQGLVPEEALPAPPLKPKRTRAPHKPGCKCMGCIHRRSREEREARASQEQASPSV